MAFTLKKLSTRANDGVADGRNCDNAVSCTTLPKIHVDKLTSRHDLVCMKHLSRLS